MDVDLYEDLGGKYFPLLEDPDKCYRMRSDGRVEVISVNEHSSQGKVVPDARGKIRNQAS
jgi:hypothetical protein